MSYDVQVSSPTDITHQRTLAGMIILMIAHLPAALALSASAKAT